MGGSGSAPGQLKAHLVRVKARARAAQYRALRLVNTEQILLYWDIGRIIVDRQRGDTWGKAVVEKLAADLRTEFPGTTGYSADNLWRMRKFYLHYGEKQKLAPLVQEIARHHPLQRKAPHYRRIRAAFLRETNRCGHLPHGEAPAQGVQRTPARTGTNRPIVGARLVNGRIETGVAEPARQGYGFGRAHAGESWGVGV